jgi:hypothetical protein
MFMPLGFVLMIVIGGAAIWYIGSKAFCFVGDKIDKTQKKFKENFTKKD